MKFKNIHHSTKKIIATLFLTAIIFSNSVQVHAQWAVFDAGNTIQTTISAINTTVTSITSVLQRINMIARPFADLMKVRHLAMSGNFVRNLVLGSVGSSNALLVTNPPKWVEGQTKKVIRENLDNVAKSEGLYAEKITSSLVTTARNKGDNKANIQALAKSSIPNITQNSLCEDEDLVKLTELANLDDNIPQDERNYNTRVEELFDKLCSDNPDSNPELATVLTEIDNASFSSESFLAKVSGDNTFTRTIRAQQLVDEQTQAKEDALEMDRLIGKGIRSETECIGGEVTDESGYTYCPTGKEVITKLGAQLNEALSKALDSPRDLLSNSYGTEGIFVLLGNIGALVSTVNTTMNAFSGENTSVSTVNVSTSTGQITFSTSTYTHTLKPGIGTALSITTPIKVAMQGDKDALTILRKVDIEYETLANDYLSKLNPVKSCFSSLITEFPEETIRQTYFPAISTNSDVIASLAYLNPEIASVQAIKTKITDDFAGITTVSTLIDTTLDKILKSDSVEEISDLNTAYTESIRLRNLPTPEIAVVRAEEKGKFQQKVSNVGNEKSDALKKIDELTAKCKTIGDNERSRRDDARSNQ